MKFWKWLLLNGIGFYIMANVVPGVTLQGGTIEAFITAVIGGVVFSLVNFAIKPVLKLVSLPITIMTFGLFTLVINGLTFALAASVVPGLKVDGFISAILAFFVLSIINWLLGWLNKD